MAFIFDCKHPILFLCMWCPFLSPFWSGSDNTWKNASKGSTSYWWNIDGSLHFCHTSVIYRRINTSDESCQGSLFPLLWCRLRHRMYQFHAGLRFSGSIVTNFPHLSSLPQIWGFTSNSCTFELLTELSDLKMFVWGLYAKIGLETMYILLLLDIFFMRGRFELINLENKRVLIPTNNVSLFLCTSNTSTSNAICNFFLLLPCKCNSHEN